MGDEYEVTRCSKCPALVECRSQIVNGIGPMEADILIIGEAPGQNEDEKGQPFIGRSGDELDSALEAAGVQRGDVRITNTVRCRPPDNRDPTAEERRNCKDYLEEEIQTVNPTIIIPVGKVPSEELLDRDIKITTEAGTKETYTVDGTDYTVLLCPHPAAMFYNRDMEPIFYDAIEEAVAMST